MAGQTSIQRSLPLPISALDQEVLALFKSLRDNPETQKDSALCKVFNDAMSFITAPVNTLIINPSSFIRIDTSGEDGDNGSQGTMAVTTTKGTNGSDGDNGANAKDIHLQLMVKDGVALAQWGNGNSSMRLGDSSASIFLRAIGGRGGKGGNGGRGGPGLTGARGKDADRHSNGTNGARGFPGKNGGNGGDGGNGGKGGNIQVSVNREDSDLLMLLNTEIAGGVGGKGGVGGIGGVGGEGGEGGKMYEWSEPMYSSKTAFDSRGLTYSVSKQTGNAWYSNPGGSKGSQGPEGDDGIAGDNGRVGTNGSLQMIVGGIAYRSLYELVVVVSKIVDLTKENPAEFYEPGEQVNLSVSIFNAGGMPTPPQDIEVSMNTAPWLEMGNSSHILRGKDCLPVEGSYTFPTPFSFRIKEPMSPSEKSLNIQEMLTYRALLLRVNRSFSLVSQQKDVLPIKYPVQIAAVQGKISAAFNQRVSLNLLVQNVTSINMGKSGPQRRRVFVVFDLVENQNVKSTGVELLKIEDRDIQEANKVSIEVDHLFPKSEKRLSVGLRFKNQSLPDQSKIDVVASLFLDYLNLRIGEQARARCIQKQIFQVQLNKC